MNKAELMKVIGPLPDDSPVAILLADGTLDYATSARVVPDLDDDGDPNPDAGTIVIDGN